MRRFIPRFSLKTLLLLMTAICVFGGYWAYTAEKQRVVVASLRSEKYNVSYDTSPNGLRAKLGTWLGADYVSRPIALYGNNTSDFHGDLETVSRLTSLKKLTLDFSAVNDDDLASLHSMPHLDFLMLNNTHVTDAGMKHLVGVPLVSLHLEGLPLTDRCVEDLARISTLRWLELPKSGFSDVAVQRLQVALPNCKIVREK